MARKIYYKIADDGRNILTDDEWEQIGSLQHWYNSEFIWTAGKLGFRLFAVFPNTGTGTGNEKLFTLIRERQNELRKSGCSESETVRRLEEEGLIISQKGGYFKNCLASGFTRVAGNEFNAYLVCEFLLKASRIARRSKIEITDEGEFVKTKKAVLCDGSVYIGKNERYNTDYCRHLAAHRQIFSIVNPAKYDNHPYLKNDIPGFALLTREEKKAALMDWNWLGFGNTFDNGGNDREGVNLNEKVDKFFLIDE